MKHHLEHPEGTEEMLPHAQAQKRSPWQLRHLPLAAIGISLLTLTLLASGILGGTPNSLRADSRSETAAKPDAEHARQHLNEPIPTRSTLSRSCVMGSKFPLLLERTPEGSRILVINP